MSFITLKSGEISIVDDEDFAMLSKYKWYKQRIYAVTNVKSPDGKWKTMPMHRMVAKCSNLEQVDHINMNGLDNRKGNLRVCSQAENNRNRVRYKTNASGFKGVSFCKQRQKWCAYISVNGKNKNLGGFLTPQEAHERYKQASIEFHKNFARFE